MKSTLRIVRRVLFVFAGSKCETSGFPFVGVKHGWGESGSTYLSGALAIGGAYLASTSLP
jgi:hypothetical protein